MGEEAEESRERLIRDVDVWTPRLPNWTRAAPGALHRLVSLNIMSVMCVDDCGVSLPGL
jgi:hypothetical protein